MAKGNKLKGKGKGNTKPNTVKEDVKNIAENTKPEGVEKDVQDAKASTESAINSNTEAPGDVEHGIEQVETKAEQSEQAEQAEQHALEIPEKTASVGPTTDAIDRTEDERQDMKSTNKIDSPVHENTANDDTEISNQNEEAESDSNQKKNRKKSVGFAPPPEEDLKEHHEQLKKKMDQKRQSNPFQKIPPELSYLEKKPEGPKPLGTSSSSSSQPSHQPRRLLKELGDLRNRSIKEISVQNKETELNFNYPTVHLPIQPHHVLVDVKFGSLNSFDLAKINNYVLNLSNTKVGLGYEFSGEIIEVGANYQSKYAVGDKVFGCINSVDRKGALSTNLLINPSKDVLVSIEDNILDKIRDVDIELSFKSVADDGEFEIESSSSSSLNSEVPVQQQTGLSSKISEFSIEDDLPPLAKLSAFPVLYCRAKQALDHSNKIFQSTGKASILINGADTNLGFTIIQLLNSSVYSKTLNELNLILTIRESSFEKMSKLVKFFTKGKYFDPSRKKRFHLVTFDMVNDDIVLPGEKPSLNYKKQELFASDVLNALFEDSEESIDASNVANHKLDLIVDIVGSKKFFQTLSIRYDKLEAVSLPYLSKISPDTSLSLVLKANTKEPFLMKILKPRSRNSCFVSCCKFNLSYPTYNIDDLFDYAGSEFSLNPWSMKWSRNLANSLSNYYYYEELSLRVREAWVLEGLNLVLENELKFKIDDFIDWRNNFKKYVKQLRREDGKIILKVEDF